ncbi:MAG: FAD-binding oxidoreductase [Alphaproteobacteria bacterium]|nr:FAD-binding oxidoreductase [Alphaproteobacteria bacterium]
MPQTADAIVVGAGMAGAAAAAHLAENGRRVVLLERESQPGYHSTGRSAALFTETYGNRAIRVLTGASRACYEARLDGFAEHPILTPRGALMFGMPGQQAKLDAAWADLSALDPRVRRLDAAAARAMVPVLRPDCVIGAVYEPDAMDIDVHELHQAYLRRLRRRGGRVVTDAEVQALAVADGCWTAAAAAGEFAAPVIVNAAGAWADDLAAKAGLPPVGLVPKRRTALTIPVPAGVDAARWPMTLDVTESFYFKPESGRLLVSPADETPMPPCDVQPDELDIAIAIDRLTGATSLTVGRIERKWAGLRSFVADKTTVCGFDPLARGFFWLAGQGGYGIQTAEGMARCAAALIDGGGLPADIAAKGLDAETLSPARLRA